MKSLKILSKGKYSKYSRNDLKKFYMVCKTSYPGIIAFSLLTPFYNLIDFASENFEQPVTMRILECQMIINYIIQ